MPKILDVCCGSRMFWFDRHNPNTTYMDIRSGSFDFTDRGHTRTVDIRPDVIGDFRSIPFDDSTFDLVVFDPPHLIHAGENSWLARKYGKLDETWPFDIRQGFTECMRVLRPNGFINFKWNEDQIKLSEILDAAGYQPLFGDKRGKTHWLVFSKEG
ncbi:class I SAM-dependent methyltransferase [Loigolactobacillus coryniformis]|uniref:class I SAM-dependent methyltransferase n=1 Tax=Loigolactobacillus coryniformis TaxID=1610 RepID=UPI00201ABC6C|nr:class I SAM-dependent methyltransferase [Loigolactobacillus coryniformis]MCL5458068.1 class I SAM-dependent methyltransferase [Loigolactobacillus coryniformis]